MNCRKTRRDIESMAVLTLEGLANEVFEEIVQYLDLQSILNLRLVNVTIANKASQPTFRSFLQTRYVNITKTSVERFVRSTTAANPFRHIMENIVVRGVGYYYYALRHCAEAGCLYDSENKESLYDYASLEERRELQTTLESLKALQDDDQKFSKQKHSISLLNQGFLSLVGQSGRRMKKLAFEVILRHDDPTTACHLVDLPSAYFNRDCQIAGARAFRSTIEALQNCKLEFAEVDIFHGLPASLWLGLSYENLAMPGNLTLCSHLLSSSAILSITVLTTLVEGMELPRYDEIDDGIVEYYFTQEINHAGLSALLATCSSLETLKVSFSYGCSRSYWTEYEIEFDQHAHELLGTRLPLLREIYLGGVQVNFVDASAFLLRHSATLRSIELCVVSLKDKPLSSLLSLLASENFELEDIRLSDMSDDKARRLLFDDESERSSTRISGLQSGRNTIHTWGEGTRQRILYYYELQRSWPHDIYPQDEQREGQFGREERW
jgi:hypothetical protein